MTIKTWRERMEAKLGIELEWARVGVIAIHDISTRVREPYAYHNGDRNAARRMASTRCAAAIGGLSLQPPESTT